MGMGGLLTFDPPTLTAVQGYDRSKLPPKIPIDCDRCELHLFI